MADIDEMTYMCANVVAAAKEKAIMEALSNHFGSYDWTEADVKKLDISFTTDAYTGIEILSIEGVKIIEFGRMDFDVQVETGMVQCLYAQTIKPLYGSCGAG
ncbi:MAG: hypothetical protein DRQ62_14240 [Gammaproteobacteria bacterium]|nr:MAG: hypothetical protein DRQ62_14240 [Gammaproteobacteria bacterium]